MNVNPSPTLDLLDLETLARELGVDQRTILRWRKGPRPLPAIKIRRRVVFLRQEVLAWLRSHREAPPSRPLRKARVPRHTVKNLAGEGGTC